MKKILLLTSAIASFTASFAQIDSVNNPNFDSWTGAEPNNWRSSNAAAAGSVTKATGVDIHGGTTLVLTTISSGSLIPGEVHANSAAVGTASTDGFHFRMRPVALNYVCKYAGTGGDAPIVQVTLTKKVGTQIVVIGSGSSTAASANYSKQTLTINYSNAYKSYAPDSVKIRIASSGATGAVANSAFFVDSLAFDFGCVLNPLIPTTGTYSITANNLPKEGDTLVASAGQPYSLTMTSYIPQTVNMLVPFGAFNINMSTTIDSLKTTSMELSGSASNFLTIAANPSNGMVGGNSISCFTLVGTIPASPANATYNLIITPIMWGTPSLPQAGNLSNFASPQTITLYIKVGAGSAKITSTDNINWRSTVYNGVNRVYNVYVPTSVRNNPSVKVPLLFNIHGWTGSSTKQMDFGDFRPIADTANFIIVHPQAKGVVPSWDLSGTTDTDYLFNLLDSLESQYNIDADRIYCTGFSQGGQMSYLFGCFHSGRIAAIAPVAGGLSTSLTATCVPAHPMPMMETHGSADQLAVYTTAPTPPTLCAKFATINHCNATPLVDTLPDLTTSDGATTVIHSVWSGGSCGATVEHYKIVGGGHSWPNLNANAKNNYGLAPRNNDYNASLKIWQFLRKYSLQTLTGSCTTTGIEEANASQTISVYPNPSTGSFTLAVSNYNNAKTKVIDVLGNTVFETILKSELTKIDLSNAASGVYMYQVIDGAGMISSGKLLVE